MFEVASSGFEDVEDAPKVTKLSRGQPTENECQRCRMKKSSMAHVKDSWMAHQVLCIGQLGTLAVMRSCLIYVHKPSSKDETYAMLALFKYLRAKHDR